MAVAICAGVDFLLTRTPAPSRSTRTVLSFWSRPIGMHTSGTPAASDFSTVPCPAWVTTTEASRSTRACGAVCRTSTFGPAWISAGSTARPVVSTARTGSWRKACGYPCEQVDLILVDRARRDQDEWLASLTLPLRIGGPIGVVELRPDVADVLRKLRRTEVEGWAGHHEYAAAPVVQLEHSVQREQFIAFDHGIQPWQRRSQERQATLGTILSLALPRKP